MDKRPLELDDVDDDDPASRPDDDNPELTEEDFRNMRPALEYFAEVAGPAFAESLRRGKGRPPKPDRKINQTLRLDPDVLEHFKRQGPGWQARINDVLRRSMKP
jgi:uncharacterized protein (DUF4415 family)